MKKCSIAPFLLVLVAAPTYADWNTGVKVSGMSKTFETDTNSQDSTSLATLVGSVGYSMPAGVNGLTVSPELHFGVGALSGAVDNNGAQIAEVAIDSFQSFSLKAQYAVNDAVYIYVAPAYTKVSYKLFDENVSVIKSETDYSIGAGFGYRVNENLSAEFAYDNLNDTNIFSFGVNYKR
ncbi:hypothetical protein CS022_01745 [Veronia nyctiphanis]|uniref:Outer membrane protein beta-barrel domain-containing protein n=1 Tax=Veronia nyctiphanis TaxID=1278244 RepID=A0A4Q0Z0J0_9GAMM|nr:outer membrane beta-barrel protein [Veronia nyctiphanis]RXJ74931.1 hypothetical protein CS022_01745 [Veronia nyctiphanis]